MAPFAVAQDDRHAHGSGDVAGGPAGDVYDCLV
jgi:hypothetical protein